MLRGAASSAWRVMLERDYPGVEAAPGCSVAALKPLLLAERRRQAAAAAAAERLRLSPTHGGATAVLGLMRAHPANAAVQRRGCFALWCLCRNSDTSKALVAAAGGRDAVVAAMRSQPGDAALPLNASGALRSLAGCGAPNFAAIAVTGGIKAVQLAMCAHAANANLRRPFACAPCS